MEQAGATPNRVAYVPPPPTPNDAVLPPTPLGLDPSPQKRGWGTGKTILAVCGAGIVIVVGLFVLFLVMSQRSASLADEIVPIDATIGDCFHKEQPFVPVSCDEPHHFEVYSAFYFLDDGRPGRIDRFFGIDICEADFESFVGESYLFSRFDYSYPVPTTQEWDDGLRISVCALHETSLDEMTGSASDR